jgi:hypothetical protein
MNAISELIKLGNIAKLRGLTLMPTSSTAHFVEIPPDLAKSIMAHNNISNRNISLKNVAHLAAQIRNGSWYENPQPVVFSVCGRLLNGQHRLQAIVQADMPAKMAIVLDADPATYEVMDTGNKRSLADVSGIHRETAACIRLLVEIGESKRTSVAEAKQYARQIQYAERDGGILCIQNSRVSCPVRAAYVASWLTNHHNRDYCQNSLRFLLSNEGTAPPIHLTFFRSLDRERKAYNRGNKGRRDFFNAALNLFDPACSQFRRLRSYDLQSVLNPVMDILKGN